MAKSSYNKQKEKIKELTNEIIALVEENSFLKVQEVKYKWKCKLAIVEQSLYGKRKINKK